MTYTVQSGMKTAKVIPLIKKANLERNNLKNYRPVSNLSFLSKLIECAVASEINQYIKDHDLGEPLQSAYRAQHSTETALLRVKNDILHGIDNRQVVALVLLDLSAAFDTCGPQYPSETIGTSLRVERHGAEMGPVLSQQQDPVCVNT